MSVPVNRLTAKDSYEESDESAALGAFERYLPEQLRRSSFITTGILDPEVQISNLESYYY